MNLLPTASYSLQLSRRRHVYIAKHKLLDRPQYKFLGPPGQVRTKKRAHTLIYVVRGKVAEPLQQVSFVCCRSVRPAAATDQLQKNANDSELPLHPNKKHCEDQ
jgi:hypothetical protein